MKNCTSLAAALSANFLSTTPFVANESSLQLPTYLSNNGLLLTMCVDDFCAISPQMDWISASWITDEIGASSIIPSGRVGFLLDPLASHVRCMYPSDAATLERDDAGCGAVRADPIYGSQGYAKSSRLRRWLTKRGLESYFTTNFGENASWQDVPCDFYFHINKFSQLATSWRRDCASDASDNERFESVYSQVVYEFEPFLGHSPCALENNTTNFSSSNWFLYSGECSWKPLEWQEMVNSMKRLVKMGPMVWNEVVIAMPKRVESVVLAVFYLETDSMDAAEKQRARRQAIKEAELLGGKPVLAFDMNAVKHGKPLLSCVADGDEKEHDTGTSVKTLEWNGQHTRSDWGRLGARQHLRGFAD